MQKNNLCNLNDQTIIDAGKTIQQALREAIDVAASDGTFSRREFGETVVSSLQALEAETANTAVATLGKQIEFDITMTMRFMHPYVLDMPYDSPSAITMSEDIINAHSQFFRANLNQQCGYHL